MTQCGLIRSVQKYCLSRHFHRHERCSTFIQCLVELMQCTLSGWCRLLKWSRTIGKLFINNKKKFQVKALLHLTLFNTAVSFIAQCLALVARVLVVALSLLKYWMCTPIRRDQMRSKLPRCNAQTFYRSYNNVLVIARGM